MRTSAQNRYAVITGGTSGIGLAVAREFLKRGHYIYICGRDQARLNSAIVELSQTFEKEKIFGSICDVRSIESVRNMFNDAGIKLGKIDVLVNSAGVSHLASFDELTPDLWHEMIDINLTGIFNCCYTALPWLKNVESSNIVNLGSRSGRYSFAGGTGYNATKFGLQGFSEALFLDLNKFGIKVSLVAPGTVGNNFGGTSPKDWHLLPDDVAQVIADVIESDSRATINWVEIRPSKPQ